jgi:hypothetical protein
VILRNVSIWDHSSTLCVEKSWAMTTPQNTMTINMDRR